MGTSRRVLQVVSGVVVCAASIAGLLWLAGDPWWARGWVCLGLMVVLHGASGLYLWRQSPETLRRRARASPGIAVEGRSPRRRDGVRPRVAKWFVPLVLGCVVCAQAGMDNIDDLLEPIRAKHGLPALSAAVVKDGDTVAAGAVGYRKDGSASRALVDDKFHIGSCTKSMTATLAAMLVAEGTLSWDTTLAEVFPGLKDSMHADYRAVTLEQLLSHRGGMPADLSKDGLWGKIWQNSRTMTPTEQRLFLAKKVVEWEPETAPGERHVYSNAGYAVAGAMIETVTGESWESLMKRRIFAPLKMASAGFGPPATPGQVDQPWGHIGQGEGLTPIPPGPGADNPPAIGPGGTAHCSITDFAKFAAFHLRGARGKDPLLPKASFDKLHTAIPGQDYALGWVVTDREWGDGAVLTHGGSNTMFYAVIWLAPKKGFAVVVACNAGGKTAEAACDQAAWALIQSNLLNL